jgi:multiple sugar transport system substrate-binding protein
MSRHLASRRRVLAGMGVAGTAAVLAACGATPTPEVVEKVVKETVVVTSEVEKVVKETVEVVSTQVVEKEVVVTATASPKGPVNLVFFVWMAPEQEPAVQAIFDQFNATNPEITVELQQAPGSEVDKFQKVLLMIASGTPPDFTMGTSEIPGYAARGVLLGLDPLIESSGLDMGIYNEAIVKSYLQYQGKQYGMPVMASTEVLAFNMDLFDAAGVAYPTDTWGDKSWDWATFLDDAQKLTVEKGGQIDQFGTSGLLYYMYAIRWWGARWANDEVTQITVDTPEMAAGIQSLADLTCKYHVQPMSAEWEMFGDADPLLSGKSGMQSLGLWSLLTYANSDANWAAAPWPLVEAGNAPFYPFGFYVFAGSKNQAEAWKFLEFLSTPEQNLAWATAASRMPAMPQNGPAWLEAFSSKKPNARMNVITDLMNWSGGDGGEPFLAHPKNAEMTANAITPTLDPVWACEAQASEVLPGLQAQLTEILNSEE